MLKYATALGAESPESDTTRRFSWFQLQRNARASLVIPSEGARGKHVHEGLSIIQFTFERVSANAIPGQ